TVEAAGIAGRVARVRKDHVQGAIDVVPHSVQTARDGDGSAVEDEGNRLDICGEVEGVDPVKDRPARAGGSIDELLRPPVGRDPTLRGDPDGHVVPDHRIEFPGGDPEVGPLGERRVEEEAQGQNAKPDRVPGRASHGDTLVRTRPYWSPDTLSSPPPVLLTSR